MTQVQNLGANLTDDGVRFAVWAPEAKTVAVVIEGEATAMERGEHGSFAVIIGGASAGTRYQFQIDDGPLLPDPRSRFQPEGVHGPSEVVDLHAHTWTDQDWTGLQAEGLVTYELHVGTFSPEGTFRGAISRLADLAALGIDAIELMPVADFPGRWNWGYDGVFLFAPSRAYGTPADLQALVDAAHQHGIGVVLDVVYNHFGPDGNYMRAFSANYFTHKHLTPWGDANNYDGPECGETRRLIIDNAVEWVRDYHIDGLRLDATEQIVDDSDRLVLAELGEAVRKATDRSLVLTAEEARNLVAVSQPEREGGWGLDGAWVDDFHHSMIVFLTGMQDSYYCDYSGTLQELAGAINEGFIYQGQQSEFRGEPRGTKVTDEPASAFTICLQNHDQVGNQPFGQRLHHDINRERYLTASAVLLFVPQNLLLFMGQEFMASTPFLFFTDHDDEIGQQVTEGRREEFDGLREFGNEELTDSIPDPQAEETFAMSRLNWQERDLQPGVLQLYTDLLHLRKADPVLAVHDRQRTFADAMGAQVLLVRRWTEAGERVLIANFGAVAEVHLPQASIKAAEIGVLFSSTDARYGGDGKLITMVEGGDGVTVSLPARSAVILSVPRAGATGDQET